MFFTLSTAFDTGHAATRAAANGVEVDSTKSMRFDSVAWAGVRLRAIDAAATGCGMTDKLSVAAMGGGSVASGYSLSSG